MTERLGDLHAAVQTTSHSEAVGNRFGMWLFLATEVLLFGTLFLFYGAYHWQYGADFRRAGAELDRLIGTINTLVLLTSSLTMALSISAWNRAARPASIRLMLATVGLGVAFLCIKAFEWSHKFEVGLYPGAEALLDRPRGEVVFFGLYYVMTGLHAVHVLAGAVLIGVIAARAARGRVRPGGASLIENAGLYWHLVDAIWIYLFPLFYLIGRKGLP